MSNEFIEERIEENLELLWIQKFENFNDKISITDLPFSDKESCETMVKRKLIKIKKDKVELISKGEKKGRVIVRRHRLSELVFRDIFGAKEKIHDSACKFEHIISDGVEDNICALLGHPKECPHGRLIPQGKCCEERKKNKSKSMIIPLTELSVGTKAKIVFVFSAGNEGAKKIMDMGVFPGRVLKLINKLPSYILELGESRLSVDAQIAECIFVKSF